MQIGDVVYRGVVISRSQISCGNPLDNYGFIIGMHPFRFSVTLKHYLRASHMNDLSIIYTPWFIFKRYQRITRISRTPKGEKYA